MNRRHIQETRVFKSDLGHRVTEGNGSKSEGNEPVNTVLEKAAVQDPSTVNDRGNEKSIEQNAVNDAPITSNGDTPERKGDSDLKEQDQSTSTGNLLIPRYL